MLVRLCMVIVAADQLARREVLMRWRGGVGVCAELLYTDQSRSSMASYKGTGIEACATFAG
jgi:hypothetical protein